jgi:hypothetical protein
MIRLAAATLLLLASLAAEAQVENSKSTTSNTNYSMFWLGVESGTVPLLDTKTLDSSGSQLYIAPYINYNHKSGPGIKLKTYALPGGSNPGFFMSSIMPYYATYNGHVYPFFSYTRFFMHDNPSVPYSPINNEIYGHIRIRTKWVDPWIGVDYGFGNDDTQDGKFVSDFNTFLALSHLFYWGWGAEQALGLRPMVQLNAGTDRYYKYLRTTRYISRNPNASQMGYGKKENGNSPGNGTGSGGSGSTEEPSYLISESNEFGLSNFEVNLSVMYFIGKFSIEPSGSFFVPLRGDDRSVFGYWQLNLNYWFE